MSFFDFQVGKCFYWLDFIVIYLSISNPSFALIIYQTHAMDGTISWLSLAHLVCYLHGQEFLILQHKTLTLLADQQFLDIALSIALE